MHLLNFSVSIGFFDDIFIPENALNHPSHLYLLHEYFHLNFFWVSFTFTGCLLARQCFSKDVLYAFCWRDLCLLVIIIIIIIIIIADYLNIAN